MTYHRALLEEVRDWARAREGKPGELSLDMTCWISRDSTRACLGGYGLYRAEGDFIWWKNPQTGESFPREYSFNGVAQYITEDAARDALGLGRDEAFVLFNLNEEYELGLVLDFLDALCDRAAKEEPNMTPDEVDRFVETWSESLRPTDYYV